jgi:hypothetical protein
MAGPGRAGDGSDASTARVDEFDYHLNLAARSTDLDPRL